MTKEEIYEKIESLKGEFSQEIESLEKELEEIEEEEETFNPYLLKAEEEDSYFYKIDETGSVTKVGNHVIDSDYLYNKFNSKKYAELRQREIDLQDKMWEFSYKNRWKDEFLFDYKLDVYIIYYDKRLCEMCITSYDYAIQDNEVYFISEPVANKAIKEFGDEIIELLGIRENIAKEGNIND